MKENRNRNKIGLIPIFHIEAFVSTKLYRQLTSLMMSIVISTVTVLGNTTVALADKKDDVINRIIEQYENGDISRDEAKRALIRNGVTNSPIIDLNEDEDGNELATDSDLVKKLGEKDRLIDERIRKIIEDNRDDDTSVVFAWHHEDADSIMDELDVATKSSLKKLETKAKAETEDNRSSGRNIGIYYDKFNKTVMSTEAADPKTESVNTEEENIDNEDEAAVDGEELSEDEAAVEAQDSEEMMEDDSEDEENEIFESVDSGEVYENDSEDEEDEIVDSSASEEVIDVASQDEVHESVDPYEFFMNNLQNDNNEAYESADSGEVFEDDSEDEEDEIVDSSASEEVIDVASQDEVHESVDPYEFFMNDLQDDNNEAYESVDSGEVFENDSEDEEDEIIDSSASEEVIDDDSRDEENAEENSDLVETAEADENESRNEDKEENHSVIKVDEFFEIDSYVENEDSDLDDTSEVYENGSEDSSEEASGSFEGTTEAAVETSAAKAIGINANDDKTALANTAETTSEDTAELTNERIDETVAARAIGIFAHSEKTATAQTEETTEASEEEKDYDVIDLSEYVTVSSAVKKFHEEWIESESFDSGNKIGLTLYFSIPEDVMYDKDTRVAQYSMPEGLSSLFEGKGKVISGDETVGTYKLKKNEIEITFDTAFVRSGKAIEGALFFKGRVENKTDEDCLTIELGGTAGSLDVYKEIKKTVVSDDGKVTVTATFGASTFDGDVTLFAEALDENTSQDVENAFNEKLHEEELMVSSMYTYDVFFLDEAGERIEPDGHVSIKMTFNNPIESEAKEDIKVYHVKNNDLSDIEDLTSMDDTVIKENSSGEVKNVELVTDSFSYISILSTSVAKDSLFNLEPALTSSLQMFVDGTEVSLSDGNAWTIYDQSKEYTLNLKFKEKGENLQFPNDDTWMYYNLPEVLYVEDKGPIKFTAEVDGEKIKDNTLVVKKDGDPDTEGDQPALYIQWNTSDEHFPELAGSSNVTITASVNGKFRVYQDETVVRFSDDIERTIILDDKLDIVKKGDYDPDDKKVHYTVTVTSTGFSQDIKITDKISGKLLTFDEDSISFKSIYNGEAKAIHPSVTSSDKGFETNISEMQNGEKIEITYTASFKGDLSSSGTISYEDRQNTVSATDRHHPDDPVSYTHTVDFYASLVKSGSADEIKKDKKGNKYRIVNWKIEANKGNLQNISYVKDAIGDASRSIMSYYNDEEDDDDGLTVNIHHANGTTTWNEHIPWEEVLNTDKKSWSWNVPEKDAYYEITYKTRVDMNEIFFGDAQVSNHAETDKGSYTSTVDVGTVTHSKTVAGQNSSYIEWDINISVPKEGYDKLLIEDRLPTAWIGYKYNRRFTDSYRELISIKDDSGNDYTELCHIYESKVTEGSTTYDYVNFCFYKDINHTKPGVSSSDKARTITITYRTTNNPEWVAACTEINNKDDWINQHENKAYIKTEKGECMVHNTTLIFLQKTLDKTYSGSFEQEGVVINGETQSEPFVVFKYELVMTGISGDEPTVIVDEFDPDLTYLDKTTSYSNNIDKYAAQIYGKENHWGHYDTEEGSKADISYAGNNKIKITLNKDKLPKTEDGGYYTYYQVIYYLGLPKSKAKELAIANEGTKHFKNGASWEDTGLTDSAEATYSYKPLNKWGSYDNKTNLAHYNIIVNEEKLKLLPGNNTALVLNDHFENQTIDVASIKISTEDKDGNKGDNSDKAITYDVDNENGLLIFNSIPDETKVTITYDGIPIFTQNFVKLKNTAELCGISVESYVDAYFNATADSFGNKVWLKLEKCDEDEEAKLLPGARFQLYEVSDDDTLTKLTGLKGTEFEGKDIIFTTGDDGTVKISLDYKKTGLVLYDGKRYCLEEIEAPEGYTINKDNNKYYFTITIPDDSDKEKVIDDKENGIYHSGSTMIISNRKQLFFALPDTGSFGVNIMYLMGTIMVTLGGIILALRKRKENLL